MSLNIGTPLKIQNNTIHELPPPDDVIDIVEQLAQRECITEFLLPNNRHDHTIEEDEIKGVCHEISGVYNNNNGFNENDSTTNNIFVETFDYTNIYNGYINADDEDNTKTIKKGDDHDEQHNDDSESIEDNNVDDEKNE